MNEQKCATLAKKLALILGAVGKVKKSGHNSFHNYDYVTENDLVYAVRDKLSEAGIFVFTSAESQHVEIIKDEEKTTALTTVAMRHTFIDGETGESFSVMSQGQGTDVGDKGAYKAMTGAMKYFLYKCFMIPTGDDPEGDENTDRRAASRGPSTETRTPVHTPKPAPAQASQKHPADLRVDPDGNLPEGVKWGDVAVHFGTNKGKLLADLDDRTINWYHEKWTPKPFGTATTLSAADLMLKAAVAAWFHDKSGAGDVGAGRR